MSISFKTPKNLKKLKSNEQYVSYNVESLLANVPMCETIEYIKIEIYVENKLPKLC